MKKNIHRLAVASVLLGSSAAYAANDCSALPSHAELTTALSHAITQDNGGFNLDMWATVVNRYGVVCAVTKASNINTGNTTPDPWPGSRSISAQKANTANAFSNVNATISSAWLFPAVQPNGSLFGLQFSNPVDPRVIYRGDPTSNGTVNDAMNGLKPGGVNVFGGGIALFKKGQVIGAIGVSGDTSCADHNIAWRTRSGLGKTFHDGLGKAADFEKITYGATAHPECGNTERKVSGKIGSSTN